MNLEIDHGEIGWGNFTQQFQQSPKLEVFIKSLYNPANKIQSALKQLYEERWLDTAVGEQLDKIGIIIGQSRTIHFLVENTYFGFVETSGKAFNEAPLRQDSDNGYSGKTSILNDALYRKFLYWRIAVINGHGTASDIHRALSQILNIQMIRIADLGNANVSVYITLSDNTNLPLLNSIQNWIPKAAGIGYTITTSPNLPFGFKEQSLYRFGVGTLAKELHAEE